MKVVSVTVNYKTPQLTVRAVDSVLDDVQKLGGRVVVVDNDSKDGSFELISSEVASRNWNELVKVVRAPMNGGFGYGINFAINAAVKGEKEPEYFYLLGSDATIVPGSLDRLVIFMDTNPKVGLAGSRTYNPDGSLRISAFRFPNILSEIESGLRLGIVSNLLARWTVRRPIPKTTTSVDWVSAASLIIRREALEQVGMFDESYFLYFEETDLCKRFRAAGWPIYYVVESAAIHVGQASTGLNNLDRPRPGYWFDSRRYYFLKHHGALGLWCANLLYVLSHLLWRARRRLQGKPESYPPRFLSDFVRHSFWPLHAPCSDVHLPSE